MNTNNRTDLEHEAQRMAAELDQQRAAAHRLIDESFDALAQQQQRSFDALDQSGATTAVQ